MSSLKTLVLATVSAITFAGISQAATVSLEAGRNYNVVGQIQPTMSTQFDFTVTERLTIRAFALSGTGQPEDVADVLFGFAPVADKMFTVMTQDGISTGTGFLPGATYEAGDMFSILFTDGITDQVGLSISFNTLAAPLPPAVPLPAAGGLLLFAVAGTAGAAFKKRRKSA